jgi:hypothetical protein
VLAKGDFSGVILSGGGLSEPIIITDPALHTFFAFSDFAKRISPPAIQGDGYLISRGWPDDNGQFAAWDSLRYYPNADSAGGAIYYVGLIDGSSEYDHHWFVVSPDADAVLRRLIAEHSPVAGRPLPESVILASLFVLIILGLAASTIQSALAARHVAGELR